MELVVGSGNYYTGAVTKEKMVEFRVYASEKLLLLGTSYGNFGGNLGM